MALNTIYMIPHGDELIDTPNTESLKLSQKLKELAEKDSSEILVVLSPHGVNLSRNIAVINTEYFEADTKLKDKYLYFRVKNERKLTEEIIRSTADTTEELRFVTYSGELSTFPLDFGSSIPLYFFRLRNIVLIGQSRINQRDKLVNFGKSIYRTVEGYEKSVSIIISADQAHTHSSKGPYGYSLSAERYENTVKNCFETGSFQELYEIDQEIVDTAKPDSFWNLMVMNGILQESKKKMHLDYGYVETYFGMMLAHST
ncbi:MAG: DODA-type extradiol aromatic ring-opening family dioxygenase [Thermoplasmataceae archaeon]